MKKKIFTMLALLCLTATGAWADWTGGTYTATTNETLVATAVSADATLTINKGITVTVNNGLTIAEGATLTVTGGGTLEVYGTNGAKGQNAWFETIEPDEISHQATPGGDGTVAISGMGNLYVKNAIIIANGGNGGLGGDGDESWDIYAASGGNGANAITGVSVIFEEGMLTAIGGSGGLGGNYLGRASTGSDATGFASFPAIAGATLSYSDNGTDYTKYPSGNTSLHKYLKVEPKTIEVIINDAKSEASFEMPAYDLTVDYELVRDMEIGVDADIAERIRIQMNGGNYELVDATLMVPVIVDVLDGATDTLTVTTDYTVTLQKKEGENWVAGDANDLSVATYRFKVTGAGLYDGVCYTNEFQLFQGYEVEVGAESFATFYKDEKLTVEESSTTGELYTISSVSADEAVLSAQIGVAPANTPLLVYNSGSEKKTILLIPTDDQADNVTAYGGFKGTLVASTIPASTNDQTNYALNGKQFVWVKNALSIAANKCWLEVVNSNARAISIMFNDEETTGISTAVTTVPADGDWYDLNGRKVTAPTRKGVYIHNGKKVVIK